MRKIKNLKNKKYHTSRTSKISEIFYFWKMFSVKESLRFGELNI
jgi:hypothetical protein